MLYKKYVITQSKTRKLLSNEQKLVQMSCYCKDSKRNGKYSETACEHAFKWKTLTLIQST
jgi:hypothetical protein